ncbi:MAG: PAS domain-containing protein, partial [Candidatus Omnitrophica bacterium]|nr:PAS domain-containing protein [Candidatus Omnitrophota bacterium]
MISLKEEIKQSIISFVASLDKEGRILTFSCHIPELNVYVEEEIKNEYWVELFVPTSYKEKIRYVLQEMQEKNLSNFCIQLNLICRAKEEVPFLVNISFLKEIEVFLVTGKKMVAQKEDIVYYKRLESIVMNISTMLVGVRVSEIDKSIDEALRVIGKFTEADRAYAFCVSEDRTKVYYAYEWCKEGITPQKGRVRELMVEDFPWLRERLERRKEVVYIPSVEKLPPEALREQQEFREEQTKSVLLVPMLLNGVVTGFLGFDSVFKEREWDDDCVFLLKIVGEILANALARKQTDFAIEEGRRFVYSVFESIQDGISILDKELNIISVNHTMEKWYAYSMPLVGKKCYFAYHKRKEPCTICPTQKTLKTQKQAYEVVAKCGPEGETVGWVDLYSFPLFDSLTGEMKGVIEYVRDATERKKAEDLLHNLTLNLRRTNKKLKLLSLKDSHTGLYNYHYLT